MNYQDLSEKYRQLESQIHTVDTPEKMHEILRELYLINKMLDVLKDEPTVHCNMELKIFREIPTLTIKRINNDEEIKDT